MIFILFLVFCHVNHLSSEIISGESWSKVMQDLTVKFHENKIIESHPLNEGFMLLPDQSKKVKLKSSLCNTSSTTCPTIILITTKSTKKSTTALIDHSIGHLGRRLLNEPSYDVDDDVEELSKHLFNSELMVDGSGDTTEETTEMSTTTTTSTSKTSTSTTTVIIESVLSNNTKFIIEINCTNASNTFEQILQEINKTLGNIQVSYKHSNFECDQFGRTNFTLEFTTDNDTSTITNLFEKLWEIAVNNNGKLFSENLCSKTTIDEVSDVTLCYVINKCSLCGTNPVRGICQESRNESACTCFQNTIDPLRPYVGPLCREQSSLILAPSNNPARWTPVIVGILAGLTGLFCAITCCLWGLALWRQRRHSKSFDLKMYRLWHLPRAQIPTSVTSANVQTYLDNTNSTISSAQTSSKSYPNQTIDSTFFRELDDNIRTILPSSDTDSISTIYDPIHELDSVIDNEDVEMTFHDPLNEFDEDDKLHEFVNPNLQIPRANLDSQPTGLASFFNKIF